MSSGLLDQWIYKPNRKRIKPSLLPLPLEKQLQLTIKTPITMKQFVTLITLAMALVSNAQLRFIRDLASYANPGANTRSAVALVELQPIGIVRSVFNGPTGDNPDFDFSYETENGIKQEASGTMKDIGGTEVMVMRGSYSYVDQNGDDVLVSWVADERGFRAESDILPIAPAIPFPDQAEAVAAQIRFAQEETARNANSGSTSSGTSYTAASSPEPEVVAARASTNYGDAAVRAPSTAGAPPSYNYGTAPVTEEPQVLAARASNNLPYSAPVLARAQEPLAQYAPIGIRLVEVAQPTVVVDEVLPNNNEEPVVQVARDFSPQPLAERVAPAKATSRQQPDYIRYLFE